MGYKLTPEGIQSYVKSLAESLAVPLAHHIENQIDSEERGFSVSAMWSVLGGFLVGFLGVVAYRSWKNETQCKVGVASSMTEMKHQVSDHLLAPGTTASEVTSGADNDEVAAALLNTIG